MSYPILINYSKEETKKIHKYLIIGFYITIPFVIFELGFDIQIVNLFSERLEPTRSIYEGINRIRATFTEPSYYAIYLCSLLYIFTNSKKTSKKSRDFNDCYMYYFNILFWRIFASIVYCF